MNLSLVKTDSHLPERPFTTSDIESVATNRYALAQAISHGDVRRPFRGVYLAAQAEDDPVKRAEALVQVVSEHQVISDRTAAWVHGINTFTQTEMAQVPAVETCAVRGHTRTRRPGTDGRSRDLLPEDIEVIGGVRVTTPLRTALDLGCNLNHYFTPPAERARKYIDDKELGELLFVNMALWIDNPNESSPYFHLRALHPHSIDVMRYFCGDVTKVHAFFTKPTYRKIWSNAQINMLFANGCVGHLTGSYDMSGNHPIERCEVAGTEGRFIIENVFESLTFMPRRKPERIVYQNNIFGGVGSFRDTFRNRINRFVEQVDSGCKPEEMEASGADGLAAQRIIEAAIKSNETGKVVKP